MDFVVLLHGDGQYAPESLPDLLYPIIFQSKQIVFGSRMIRKADALKGGMPLYKWFGNQILTFCQNLILGMNLSEFHSGYRLYSTNFLRAVHFLENSDGFDFDTQIIIQSRIAGIEIHEEPISTHYGEEVCHVDGVAYAIAILKTTIQYRMHQLHFSRHSIFLANESVIYTRKHSPFGSHEQIIGLVEKGPVRVLDLGSADGLITRQLVKDGAIVTVVDISFEENKKIDGVEYAEMDLDHSNRLPFEREFDYIIVADLIEHLVNAKGFLTNLQYLLVPSGKLILSTPNIAIWFYRLSLLVGRFNYRPRGTLDATHVHLYTQDTIKALLENSGFRVTKISPTSLPFELAFESVGKSKLLKLVDKSYFSLARFWKRMFAYQFILVGEITHLDAARKKEGIVDE